MQYHTVHTTLSQCPALHTVPHFVLHSASLVSFHLNNPSCEMGCHLSFSHVFSAPSVQRRVKTPISQLVALSKQCRGMELSCQWVTGVEGSRNRVLPRRGSQREGGSHSNFYTSCFGCGNKCPRKMSCSPHTPLVRTDHLDNGGGLVRLEERCLPPSPVLWSSTYLSPKVLIQCWFSMDSWWLFVLWKKD